MGARLTNISNFRAFTGLVDVSLGWNSLTSFPTNEITSNLLILDLPSNDITLIDANNIVSLERLEIGSNQITNIDISNNVNLISAPFASNQLTETSVNNILIQLDNHGLLNGFCYTAGGANAAPTGAGITAKNNLIAKGWTVNTN